MDRHLRPAVLTTDPSSPEALKTWRHWKRTFDFFLESLPDSPSPNKLATLVIFVGPSVYELIAESADYDNAITILESVYDKPKNEVFARHLLSCCKQGPGETLDQYLQKLKTLAKDCNFRAYTAEVHKNEAIRDAFISGLISPTIRQRLLEKTKLDLDTAYENARTLEMAEKQSLSYRSDIITAAAVNETQNQLEQHNQLESFDGTAAAGFTDEKCFFCGYKKHPRSKCPAREATCKKCSKIGHFAKVCMSTEKTRKSFNALSSDLAASHTASAINNLKKAQIDVYVHNVKLKALVDTGSSDSYINSTIARANGWKVTPSTCSINMASTSLTKKTQGHCIVPLLYKDRNYTQKLSLLPDLCADVVLGHDFLGKHSEVCFPFEGSQNPLKILGVAAANVEAPHLFENLTENCKPIATKSRRHSNLESH